MLYPKPCYNEPCYQEVVEYSIIFSLSYAFTAVVSEKKKKKKKTSGNGNVNTDQTIRLADCSGSALFA